MYISHPNQKMARSIEILLAIDKLICLKMRYGKHDAKGFGGW